MNEEGWRPLTQKELRILEFMLAQWPEYEEYLEPIGDLVQPCTICSGEHCRTIEFRVPEGAQLEPEVPLSQCHARGINQADGVPFDVALFARGRHLSMLEFIPYGFEDLAYVPDVADLMTYW